MYKIFQGFQMAGNVPSWISQMAENLMDLSNADAKSEISEYPTPPLVRCTETMTNERKCTRQERLG